VDTILILDFGSQTTQLISRRIRESGVYSVIVPGDTPLNSVLSPEVRGVILSGSPCSVYDEEAPRPDERVYSLDIPVLGICYGAQRIIQDHGGRVSSLDKKEYGRARIRLDGEHPLFAGFPGDFVSWMSHGDTIDSVPKGFSVAGWSENGLPGFIVRKDRKLFGIQFHPEVTHTEQGGRLLENFAVGICGARKQWNVETYLDQIRTDLAARVGDKETLLLISGGVDSTVVAALLLDVLAAEQVHLMYIDTGLMRQNETGEVRELLQQLGARNLHFIDASGRFYEALRGEADPEQKRRIIGDLFVTVQAQEVKRLGIANAYLAQGTLYTDLIESGKGVGSKAKVIKSHHNVRSPLIEEKRARGLLLEPLSTLYKDEVRELGRRLGLSEATVKRHPFPGPGLAVRILGEVTPDKCDLLRQADAIYIRELKARGLYDRIWQAFAVLLPIRSVGVSGDLRRYGYVLALRAVVSRDGMTADVFHFPPQDLLEISARITNSVRDIGRVVYDTSSKPPATIEWE
jgi:GMP synthase (glutamine-hydrolysing)